MSGVPVLLSNVIDSILTLLEHRPALQTRAEIMRFLDTIKRDARSAEEVVREANIPLRYAIPPFEEGFKQ